MTDALQAPVVKAQMLIRRPVAQVFEAFRQAGPVVAGRVAGYTWPG